MDKYQEILAIQPDHPLAMEKTAQLKQKIEEYANLYFERGVAAYDSGDIDQARSAFLTVVRMSPGHTKAQQYLTRLSAPSGRSASLLEKAQENLNRGEWETVILLADSVLGIDPGQAQAIILKSRALDQIDSERLILKAKIEYNRGNFLNAIDELDLVLKRDPRHPEALELRDNCQNRLNEQVDDYFNRGIQLYTEEQYAEAITMWDIVLRINPDHKGALDYKNKASERLEALQSLP